MNTLIAESLQCIKQDRELFAGFDLTVETGETIHLKGDNGAGKTSLLRILAGLSEAQAGKVKWNHCDIVQCRSQYNASLLYLGHKLALNMALSAIENLCYWRDIQVLDTSIDVMQLLELMGLVGLEDVPIAQLSAGQKRRVSLSRIWLKRPELLILDEPFNALDVKGRQILEQKLLEHVGNGGMLILTSHWQLPGSFDVREVSLEYRI